MPERFAFVTPELPAVMLPGDEKQREVEREYHEADAQPRIDIVEDQRHARDAAGEQFRGVVKPLNAHRENGRAKNNLDDLHGVHTHFVFFQGVDFLPFAF